MNVSFEHFPRHVLVVDDAPSMRAALREVLQTLLGYSVDLAANAEQALAILATRDTAFSVVILDRNLPGMTGDELVARLAELWPTTPVVLMSGDAVWVPDLDAVPQAHGGRLRLLKKPFSTEELGRVLEEVVAGHSPRSQGRTDGAVAPPRVDANDSWRKTEPQQSSNLRIRKE